MNQDVNDKKDKTGGDVTKSEVVPTPKGDKTHFDIFNNTGAERLIDPVQEAS